MTRWHGAGARRFAPVLGVVILGTALASAAPAAAQDVRGAAKSADALRLASGSIQALVERVSKSVVQVVVSGYQPLDPNGRTEVALGRGRVIGSGVVVEESGYVMTNAHVVAGAERIQVILDNAPVQTLGRQTTRQVDARLVGISDELDLALLKIDAPDVPVLTLADYDRLKQGELVFAFGSPDGLRNSVTMGMVSSVARQVDEDSPLVYVQTDAPINPGNSGGPLVNAAGEVVGINTFIQSASGGSEGLGFALPSALIALAYPQLRDFGHLHRGLIGLTVQTVTPLLASGLHLPADAALIAANVAHGSPADTAGITPGDIIVAVDGEPVASLTMAQLYLRLYALRSGQTVRIDLARGDARKAVIATAVEIPHVCDRQTLIDVRNALIEPLGVFASAPPPDQDDPSSGDGPPEDAVLVTARVETGHPGAPPLQRGDLIRAINGARVSTPAALREAVERVPARGAVVLQVEREGRLEYMAFERE